MPRRARIYVPGLPYHLVQRGNNRDACFFADDDYLFYLQLLQENLLRYDVSLHSFVLMTNHIHLLLTPQSNDSISRMMSVVGSRYAYYLNKTYKRSGTVWEGRHKSSLVDTENYLLKCYRYIELNPVVANMVGTPDEYRWSSYLVNAWNEQNQVIIPHEEYLKLGKERENRAHNYRELFAAPLSGRDVHLIRNAAHFSHPVGNARFVESVEQQIGKSLGFAKRDRPLKAR